MWAIYSIGFSSAITEGEDFLAPETEMQPEL
jgi:hypothetical protein